MENGASLLKKLGIIFLCIGTLGVSGSLILCFIVPSLWLFSIIFGSVLAVFLIVGIICMIIYSTKKGKKEKIFGETVFREGDRVMQIRNNYDIVWCKGGDTAAIIAGEMAPGSAPETGTGIFNGDLGTILRIDTENELIWIDFDEKLAWYGFEQLGELDHAFAVTVHKAQGSEYRAVVLAAGRAPARLLSRDLLYTAVTRARELLVVVGETAIVQAMIENGRKTRRYSGLRARLAGEV